MNSNRVDLYPGLSLVKLIHYFRDGLIFAHSSFDQTAECMNGQWLFTVVQALHVTETLYCLGLESNHFFSTNRVGELWSLTNSLLMLVTGFEQQEPVFRSGTV